MKKFCSALLILAGLSYLCGADLDLQQAAVVKPLNNGERKSYRDGAGRTVGTDPKTSRRKGNIVKHNDNPLRRDVKIGAELQHTAPGQVHIGLGLQQKYLFSLVGYLAVQPLVFQLIYLAAQLSGQDVQRPEAGVVTGLFVFAAGIAQADDEPVFT